MEGRIVTDPEWNWWIIFYFYFGGIAAGAYFIGTLVDLVGVERDRPIAKVAYYVAAPLVVVCGILLILDLTRPERFWHMLIQSNTGLPMFKYWSPMSVGAWALLLFGGFASASFVGALAEDGRFGLRRFSGLAGYLHRGPVAAIFQVVGCLFGFFIASYTGALLTATNQPFWSDSPLIGGLFLASAASTGIATLLLVLSLWRSVPSDSVANLERTDRWAMLLELVLLIAFVASLGSLAPAFVGSIYGILLIVVTLALGVLVPLVLSWRTHPLGPGSTVIAAVLVLIGGFVLRYAIVMAGQQVSVAGR
ncbi:MAG TPA: NrfD/PsrC family molybdoenzyme membrane anchor subunit [Roseiflexaceae bacterium]|nr:NrfD/PsrC family molybdoenzyme membrane anchor subunit [Roseiflexaceae bacterium]